MSVSSKPAGASSSLTKHDVRKLFKLYNIPSTYFKYLVPKPDDKANNPPEGYISVYQHQLEKGLRFPLHDVVSEICRFMNIPPSQIMPIAHSTIVGFILCAKFYKIPLCMYRFFSLFEASKVQPLESGETFFDFRPIPNKNETAVTVSGFLEKDGLAEDGLDWATKFFFIKDVLFGSWRCPTEWSEKYYSPRCDDTFHERAIKVGIYKHRFRVADLLQKDLLVLGGIEIGVPLSSSPAKCLSMFKCLMHRAAVTKFRLRKKDSSIGYLMHRAKVANSKLRPEHIPPDNVTIKVPNKSPLSAAAAGGMLNTLADFIAALSPPEVPINEGLPSTCENAVPHQELFREEKNNCTVDPSAAHKKTNSGGGMLNTLAEFTAVPSINEILPSASVNIVPHQELFSEKNGKCAAEPSAAYKQANSAVLVSDEAQPQPPLALPQPPLSPLLAISKALESMFVPKESYEKLEKGKEEVTSELALTKSRVQELEQEIELYKAKRVESDYRTSQAMVKVKILEKRLENVKSDSDCLRDKIKKEVMDEFKSSDDFANAVHEEAVKYYVNGFETCKLRVLNSGELPSGFNFEFLDVAGSEWGSSDSSPMPVDKAMDDLGKKSLKRKKT